MNTGIVGFTIFYSVFFKYDKDTCWGWFIISGAAIIGLPIAYISWKYIRIGAIQVGLTTGFFFALLLQEAVLYLIPFEWTLVIAIGVLGVAMIIIAMIFLNEAFNPFFAFIGSFMIARGIGLILDYDYEFTLYY